MGTSYSAIITLIVTAGVINVIMGIYVLANRSKQMMSNIFIIFCMLAAVYTFGSALELAAGSLDEIKFWIKFEYLGMPFLPPLNLLLIMHFLGMDRYFKRFWYVVLFIIPVITVALVFTNEWHHFYYQSVELRTDTAILKANLEIGPWYIIQGGYTFGCMTGGVVLLLLNWNRMKASYRIQFFTMLFGLLLPLAGDYAYLSHLTPYGLDPIPVMMALTSAMYMWALTSKGLMNVAPIARDRLFESMSDGVLVLDMNNRLVDYNPSAANVMPELSPDLIGQAIEPFWKAHTDEPLVDSFILERRQDAGETGTQQEILWLLQGEKFYYHIRSSIVRKRNGQQSGKLIVMIDVTERTRLQQRLRDMAYYDGLTGIFNRSYFVQTGQTLLSKTVFLGEPLALVLFDVDYFKRINDTFGHSIGDEALIHVVQICQRVLRHEDVFARYGGEEFVVAMPGVTAAEAWESADQMRRGLAEQPLELTQGPPLTITASFGVAAVNDVDAHSEEDGLNSLLIAADRALYEAKRAGRNTVKLADGVETASISGT
ncbi:histidine kinase N-terminal 7TM domain-containing protein [Paenibacillus sp. GXUN7292]|uniref:histidine kinase N-terminal 7TM domain-containing diguanylate cyclase n=1 Tax=Paenibacillus sp. GXUN7292 TaxID=3422499 RepID=UPI003D7DB834